MPKRLIPLVNEEYYHIFNRGVNRQPIFFDKNEYNRELQLMEYYSISNPKPKYSKFLSFSRERRTTIFKSLKTNNKKLVDIVCFCLMPNHFHFLLKQLETNGITKFMKEFQNSYTKYFNTKNDRIGPLLQGQFKALRIEDNNQLLHIMRYIHLNPFTSFVVKNLLNLDNYYWSSHMDYLEKLDRNFCSKDIIIKQFENIEGYKNFIRDQAEYQKELGKIKHLLIEKDD